MKRIFKLAYMALAVLAVASFSACTDEYEYDGPSKGNATGFYLVQPDEAELMFRRSEAKTFPVTVHRADSTEAATVALTSDDAEFNLPSSVSFAAGEGTKEVDVTFDNASMGIHYVTISVPSDDAFVAGASSITYKVIVVGTEYSATLSSTALYRVFGYQYPISVEIYQIDKNAYRIINPYERIFSSSVAYNLDITVNENGVISLPEQTAFTYGKYGDFVIADMNVYYTSKKQPLSDEENPSYFDEENGIFTIYVYFDNEGDLYGFYRDVFTITGVTQE